MNLLKILLGDKDVYNPVKLEQLKKENEDKLTVFHRQFKNENNYDINDDVLRTLGLKRLLDCYEYNEIINILRYYKQIK